MNRNLLLEKTVEAISLLPDGRLKEVAEFVGHLSINESEEILNKDITMLNAHGGAFDFLNNEEELYTDDGLIVKYK